MSHRWTYHAVSLLVAVGALIATGTEVIVSDFTNGVAIAGRDGIQYSSTKTTGCPLISTYRVAEVPGYYASRVGAYGYDYVTTSFSTYAWFDVSNAAVDWDRIIKNFSAYPFIYAFVNYDLCKYTLHYDANGGIGGGEDATYIYTNEVTVAAAATRSNYTFNGWRSDGSGSLIKAGATVTGSEFGVVSNNQQITLYAQWNVNRYMVTYDSNGGEGGCVVKSEDCTNNTQAVSADSLGFSREHYDFDYWQGNNGLYYGVGDTLPNHDIVLQAVWAPSRCHIDVTAGSHGSASPLSADKNYGEELKLTVSADEGYDFAGWQDGNADNPRTIAVVSNAYYQANFTARVYKVTWYANGGAWDEAGGAVTSKVSYIDYGLTWSESGAVPTDPELGNMTFFGWWDNKNYVKGQHTGNPLGKNLTKGLGDQIWYAQWEPKDMVVVSATVEPEGAGTVDGASAAYYVDSSATLTAIAVPGYAFAHWEDGSEVNPREIAVTGKSASEISVTASFTGMVYQVSFTSEYPLAVELSPTNVTFGGQYGALPTARAEERKYAFKGWRLDDGTEIAEDTVVATPSNHVLWAVWEEAPSYSVEFLGNGGVTGAGAPAYTNVCYVDCSETLPMNRFARTGYAFEKWQGEVGGETTDFADGAVVSNLVAAGETATLTACWRPITYTLHFEPSAEGVIGEMADIADCRYDAWVEIDGQYRNFASTGLQGWATNEAAAEVIFAANGLSNATATAGATVNLYAVWGDVGELSKAVGLTNASLSTAYTIGESGSQGEGMWQPTAAGDAVECVLKNNPSGKFTVEMTMRVNGTGYLSFDWERTKSDGRFSFTVEDESGHGELTMTLPDNKSESRQVILDKSQVHVIKWIANVIGNGTAVNCGMFVSNVRWTPADIDRSWGDAAGLTNGVLSVENTDLWNTVGNTGEGIRVKSVVNNTKYKYTVQVSGAGSLVTTIEGNFSGQTKGSRILCSSVDGETVVTNTYTTKKGTSASTNNIVVASSTMHTIVQWFVCDKETQSGSIIVKLQWIPAATSVKVTTAAGATIEVPNEWIAQYLPDADGTGEYLTKTSLKANGDQVAYWQDYVAGTDPSDTNSVFKIKDAVYSNGVFRIVWEPDLGAERQYVIYGKTNLTDAVWMTPTNSAHRFFRVEVSLP